MMLATGGLVARGFFAGQADCMHSAFGNESLEMAIDGCPAYARLMRTGSAEQLGYRQGAGLVDQHLLNHSALAGPTSGSSGLISSISL